MDFQGYRLLESRKLPDYHGTGFWLEHRKSGASVFYLYVPEDDNKLFCISFATPSDNDCGTAHILEHTLLNGSRKFPTKEPFSDLLRGSLATFLNAMTTSDMTRFPAASRNEKDFRNLMDVYLDGVFHPKVMENDTAFLQEGWHFEEPSQEAPVTYQGVVYNEMKGEYSDPESHLYRLMNQSLFPDTPYRFDSGGVPSSIVSLTYETFREYYRRHYHPENSCIFLYGNGDMKSHLEFLDKEYLSEFIRTGAGHMEVPLQKPFPAPRRASGTYSVSQDSDTSHGTYLADTWVTSESRDPVQSMGLSLLGTMMAGSDSSPVRQALLQAGLGSDIYDDTDDSLRQFCFSIVAEGAEPDQIGEFTSLVRQTLAQQADKGIEPDLKLAVLRSAQFHLQESLFDDPMRGYSALKAVLRSWMDGGSPFEGLFPVRTLQKISSTPHFFEDLLTRCLLRNPHEAVVTLQPEPGLGLKEDEKVRRTLALYKASLSAQELSALTARTRQLHEEQRRPDRPEDTAKIPHLAAKDCRRGKLPDEAWKKELCGVPVYGYTAQTGQITHLAVRFSLDHVPEEYLPYSTLLAVLLGALDTKEHSYTELDKELGSNLGGFETSVQTSTRIDGTFDPYLSVSLKFLNSRSGEAFCLLKEILEDTLFADTGRILQIFTQQVFRYREGIVPNASQYAVSRAMSCFSPLAAYREKINGLSLFWFLQDLVRHWDKKGADAIRKIQETLSMLVWRENMTVRLICEPEQEETLLRNLTELIGRIPEESPALACDEIVRVKPQKIREGIVAAGTVQYIAKAGPYQASFSGAVPVMMQILELEYLWAKVRVEGGAYGVDRLVTRFGQAALSSYRDPNLCRTLKIFDEAGEWLSGCELSEDKLSEYKIGAYGRLDPLLSLPGKAVLAMDEVQYKVPRSFSADLAQEALQTTLDDIRASSIILRQAMESPYLCVIGSETALKENRKLFDTIVPLY